MRKLMIAVLALAVVFGFAACDNSNGTPDSDQTAQPVVELIVSGVPEVFVGEKPAETSYTVQVRYFDGTIADAPADSLKFNIKAPAEASSVSDEAYTTVEAGTVEYVAYNYNKTVPAGKLTAVAHEIKALVVEGPENPENYYKDATATGKMFNGVQATADALFNKGAYTVNAVYDGADGEDATEALSSEEYTVAYTDTALGAATATFTPVIGVVGEDPFSQDASYTSKNTANIIIIADSETGWTATAKDNVSLVQGQASADVELSEVADVVVTYASKTTSAAVGATGSWTAGTDASGKFNAASATMTVTYGTSASNTQTLSFDVVTPRVSEITSATVTVKAADVASEDKDITIGDVVVAVKWLNDIEVADAFADGANISVDGKTGADTVIATIEAGSEADTYVGTYLVRLTKYNEIVGNNYVMLTIEVGADA